MPEWSKERQAALTRALDDLRAELIAEKDLSSIKSALIQIAGSMAMRRDMPSMSYEDWGWTKGMQTTNWRKVEAAAAIVDEKCRRWSIMTRELADKL